MTAIGLLAVAVPIIVIGVVSISQSMGSITDLARKKMGETARSLAGGLDLILREQLVLTSSLVKFDSLISVLKGENGEKDDNYSKEFFRVQKAFTEIKESQGNRFSSLVLVARDEKVIASSENGKYIGLDLRGRDYLKKVFQGKPSIGSVVISRGTGKVIVTTACPVYNQSGDEILGGLVTVLHLDFISKTVEQIKSGQSGYTFLIDESGRYIIHPDKDKILTSSIIEVKGLEHMPEQSRLGHEGIVEYEMDGVERMAAYAPIEVTGWTVVNSAARDELYASARKSRDIIILSSLGFMVLALAGFFLLARGLSIPITELSGASDKIADGDFDIVVKGEDRQDELGALAKAFNNMTASIRQARREAEKNDWLKTGIGRLNEALRGDPDIGALSEKIVTEMAKYLNAQVGAIYILENGDEPVLAFRGGYAYSDPDGSHRFFKLGEGLVGQAASEKKRIVVNNAPGGYFKVISGMGDSLPTTICILPLIYEERVKGVIELGMLSEIDNLVLEFLDRIALALAIAVESAHNRARLADALEESQKFSEELQVQQEELKAANEELEEQTQLLKDSEEELRNQQEELQAVNAVLEEKNDLLEQQKHEVEDAQIAVQKKAEEAKLASMYKSEFLANMSHELRTPLNSLLLLAQGLIRNKEGNLSPEQLESSRIIYDSGSDLLNLINEILDLSKIEAGRMELQPRERYIADFVDAIQASFSHMAQNKGLTLEVTVGPGVPEQVATDPKRADQIIRNLISNAIKFTEKGAVVVTFSRPDEKVDLSVSGLDPSRALAISVKDTGIGIAPEDREIIFEAFKQADGGISRKFGGTGLGLSISRQLAQLLGGEIKVESEPGAGSTFTLYLPLNVERGEMLNRMSVKQSAAVGAPESRQAWPTTKDLGRRRDQKTGVGDDRAEISKKDRVVLVVEDDASFAGILVDACREYGFKCLAASTGEEGLDLAAQFIPDGVILDIRMPGMDGWTVLDKLKNNTLTRHIPVHIISVEEAANKSLQKGAIGHATKPIRREQIMEALEKLERISIEMKKRVLLVEDEEMMRRSIKDLIGDRDVEVDEASNGTQAIEMIKNNGYGCLILDLSLPDMTGFELLATMKREGVKVPPVIVHTSRDLTEQEEVTIREHAESIVIKGVRSQERLLDEVSLFLHRMVGKMPEVKKQMIRNLYENDSLLQGRKVLVVDDDMRTTFALSRLLTERGMIPLKAANGEQALIALEREPDVDLVLMDIMMPVMDGYEAIKRIREQERFRKLPIIALTAKAMPGDRSTCLEAGASDYLPKPLDQERLLSMMRVWLYR